MSVQIDDRIKYHDKDMIICSWSTPFNWHPSDYGFEPERAVTCCMRGFYCEYRVTDRLYLSKLSIHCKGERYPVFCGKNPDPVDGESLFGHRTYSRLKMPIHYTGTLIGGSGLLDGFTIGWSVSLAHSFEKAWAFEFDNGRLVGVQKLDSIARNYRKQLVKLHKLRNSEKNKTLTFDEFSRSKDFIKFRKKFFPSVFGLLRNRMINEFVVAKFSFNGLIKLYKEEYDNGEDYDYYDESDSCDDIF